LRYEFELPIPLSRDEIIKIFDQIIKTARLIHLDEVLFILIINALLYCQIELYFVDDEDFGPCSLRKEIGSLSLILRIIDYSTVRC
jgi:hypothetical protein